MNHRYYLLSRWLSRVSFTQPVSAILTRRNFLFGLAGVGVAALLPTDSAWAAIADSNEAINKAGRLRMLSQRIAKAYCQVGQGILPDKAARILTASQQLFRDHLAELKVYAPSAEIKATYAELEKLWDRYQTLTSGHPNLEKARLIATLNEDVLRVAHQATSQLELHSGGNVGRLINIAGRQRMLSQRMAKFYMLRTWGIKSPEMEREAQLARREFVSALEVLSKAQENDASINAQLDLARMQWVFFDDALKHEDGGKEMLMHASNVATTSERLLEVMDRVTGMYARLNAHPVASGRAAKR